MDVSVYFMITTSIFARALWMQVVDSRDIVGEMEMGVVKSTTTTTVS